MEGEKAGRVLALAEAGDKVFVGGDFQGAALPGSRRHGDPDCRHWDARPDDAVLPLQVSADGDAALRRGRFSSIGGAPGQPDRPAGHRHRHSGPGLQATEPGGRAIALHGTTLYIGGSFKKLDLHPQPSQIAALDAVTGALRAGFPRAANTGGRFVGHTGTPTEYGVPGVVYDMAVSGDGRNLYVGGDFLHFGGQGGLVSLDAATGAPTVWQPVFDRPRPVFGVTIWPGDRRSVIAATGGFGGSAQFFTPSRKGRSGSGRSTVTPPTSWPPPSASTSSGTTTTGSPTRTTPA